MPSTFPNAFGFGGGLSNPFAGFSSQARNVPIPELRDGLTIFHGKHTMDFGGDIKWIRQISSLKNDFNFPVLGLGGNIQQLSPSLRPSDILQDPSAISIYDSSFPFLLGRYAEVAANFNYDKNGNVLAPGSGKNRSFNYNEYEVYAQDSWKLRSDLTLTYGLRYILHSVPYEVNGFQSVPSVNENAFLATRVNLAAQGVSGIDALPFVSYSLGGHANGKPGYYEPDHKDFEPRIGIAFNPSFSRGLMNAVFGDRKSTVRGGFSILHDRIGGGASFGLDQNTFLFDSNNSLFYGTANAPRTSLTNDPRFTDINTLPGVPSAPDVTAPSTPNVDSSGTPFGLAFNPFTQFFQFDRKTKNPYSMLINFGIQRELPGNFLFEADYVGRLGRRLLAVGDAAEVTNFKDSTSGQFLLPAFGALQKEVTTGSAITPQPWFENQMNAAIQAQVGPGFTCADFFGVNCTEVVGGFLTQLVQKGDVSDTIQQLAGASLLDFNVAMPAQTSANAYIGNYANSSYNAFLVILRKRVSNGLEFDLNYTYSHSIDNVSDVVNNYVQFGFSGSGLVCNLQNLRICRASSDFDARHYVKANFLYDLPFGKGRLLASSAPRALNYVIGGWTWSGIATYRTGYPFSIGTGSFPTAFSLDSPAVLVGGVSGLQPGIHTDAGGNLQYFKSVDNALSAVDFPQGGAIGNRNIVTGPGLFNFDMGVAKQFAMPWSDKQVLKFRWDSFNTFNHPSFSGPASASLSAQGSFGIITSTASAPRVMQFALRYEF